MRTPVHHFWPLAIVAVVNSILRWAGVRALPLQFEPVLRVTALKEEAENYPDIPDYVYKTIADYPPEAQAALNQEFQDAEVTPGLYQGDMAGVPPELFRVLRIGIKWDTFPERRWNNRTVPYVISKLYRPDEKRFIETAIATLNFMTCVKFVPWDGMVEDYILIWPIKEPAGCWSFVGKKGGQQILSLQAPDKLSKRCFASLGKPIHELLHALGIFHEHVRADRNDYVTIITDNVIPNFLQNFMKQSLQNTSYLHSYDYNSVMHYGSHFFSYSREKPTIVPKETGVTIGQRRMMSALDCLKVNQLYGCLSDDEYNREKYTAFCHYLGL